MNNHQGFITLTFVLFISAFLAFIVIASGFSEANLESSIRATEFHYDNYFEIFSEQELSQLNNYSNL